MLQQLPFTILFTAITNISSIYPQGSCIYPSKMEPTPTIPFFPTGGRDRGWARRGQWPKRE